MKRHFTAIALLVVAVVGLGYAYRRSNVADLTSSGAGVHMPENKRSSTLARTKGAETKESNVHSSHPYRTQAINKQPSFDSGEGQPDPALSLPMGRYVDSVASLRERANRADSAAQYVLSMMLSDCFLSAKGRPIGDGNGDPKRCDGLDVKDPAEAISTMQAAADHGLREAQIVYSNLTSELLSPTDMIRDPSMVQDYKDRSMRYLSSAADQGSGNAMLQLANAYAKGILTSQDLPLAYAYYYAEAMLRGNGDGDDPRIIYGGDLTEAQIQSAQATAQKIVDRCCR